MFFAQQWLQTSHIGSSLDQVSPITEKPICSKTQSLKKRFPTFSYKRNISSQVLSSDRFSPLVCFTPGWKGESLPSKHFLKFNLLLDKLQQDIKNQLFKTKEFPRSIKIGLFNEFLSFAEHQGLHFDGIDDMSSFWQMVDPEKLKNNSQLSAFIEIYTNRVSTVTFLKLRFIASILDKCEIPLSDKILLYPSSFLSQIFKKGGAHELQCKSLESNIYSWYLPNDLLKDTIQELMNLSSVLSISEITKTVSLRTQIQKDTAKSFSHSLSHVNVGLFLNSLQVNLPMWLDALDEKPLPQGGVHQEQIISCKYFGDYLESLSLSHWLAQENNQHFRWDEILCSDFKGLDFSNGLFAKICNELQLLYFLVHKAENQGSAPIDYICKIMGGHFKNRKSEISRTNSLFEDSPFYHSSYNRVILNIYHFPKNNPQHYLMNQISDQVKYLKQNGLLYVISSKKLFVPSLRERLDPIFKELKIEAIFDLENIKGKGELGSYIYVFRKDSSLKEEKHQCLYFRISATLNSFHDFAAINDQLYSFYLNHISQLPSLTQVEFDQGFRIEFFQEAIVNGMLIHSANEDSSRITHPAFFKGLLDSCTTIDQLYEFKPLTLNDKLSSENFLNLGLKKDLSYFLTVDFRSSAVNLELHPLDTLRSIQSDYGNSLCSYFQITPKVSGLNPNLLRNYFKTPVGRQVINLTFNGGHSLVKGSLSKLLVPRFFTQTEPLPLHMTNAFKHLELTEQQLLDSDPKEILKSFTHLEQTSRDYFPKYACDILAKLSNLENTLLSFLWKLDDQKLGHKLSFNNPIIQEQIVQRKTHALYPENNDIYLEFLGRPSDLHKPLTQTRIQVSHDGDLKLFSLELLSRETVILRLHADEVMILFIQFLLSQAQGMIISKILRAVYVPSTSDLKEIVSQTENLKTTFTELLEQVQNSIFNFFRLELSSKRNA